MSGMLLLLRERFLDNVAPLRAVVISSTVTTDRL
jgi:hypothetical protein